MASSNAVFYRSRLWTFIWVYILSIYLSLPFMRSILGFLKESLGRSNFSLLLSLTMLFVGLVILIWGGRRSLKHCALAAIPLIIIGVTSFNLSIPEERVHFLQYGLLGVMVTATARDESITLVAKLAVFAILVGVIDEAIQWCLPNRVGDLRDVAFNTVAAILGIWIGKTLFGQPSSGSPPQSP
ncbi:MAG: VanZ family protein [Halioglobus sp.]